MKLSATAGLVTSALMLAAAIPATAQPKAASAPAAAAAPTFAGQSTTSAIETPPPPGPHTLATVGNVNVGVWAPVPPPYSAENNRNVAANPVWDDRPATQSGH